MNQPLPSSEQHGVVFYREDNHFVCDAILEFCVRALKARDPLVVITTADHLLALRDKLREHGFAWAELCLSGSAAEYDAEKLLDEFSVEGVPDVRLFRNVMEEVLSRWSDQGVGNFYREVNGSPFSHICQHTITSFRVLVRARSKVKETLASTRR